MSRSLLERVDALEEALRSGGTGLSGALRDEGAAMVGRARERAALGADITVVALAGATGSGKSSLLNAIVGEAVADPGVLRPTTSVPLAAIRSQDAGPVHRLLDWLGVDRRTVLEPLGRAGSDLVLLDLPDHDSVVDGHRQTAERLYERVDLLVWVVDPQKYADAVLHERYLRPLSRLAGVMVVALNQVDRLSPTQTDACVEDLRGLLAADGLADVPVVPMSATTGEGVEVLLGRLTRAAAARRAATDRLGAEVTALADRVIAECGPASRPVRAPTRDLVDSLSQAAGVPVVVDAVGRSILRGSRAASGWPPVRWVGALRPDPLRRLHLGLRRQPGGPAVTSLPEPAPAARAMASQAIRTYVDRCAADVPDEWVLDLRSSVRTDGLADDLDRAVGSVDLVGRDPWWWKVVGPLQLVGLGLVLVGVAWLVGIGLLDRLLLVEVGAPTWRGLPVPTWAVVVGLVWGALLAGAGEIAGRVGAARAAARSRRRLRQAVSDVAQERVVVPVGQSLARLDAARSSARDARG